MIKIESENQMEKNKGTVTYLHEKGYGFLTPIGKNRAEHENNVFFHLSGLENIEFHELKREMVLDYDVVITKRGAEAINIISNDVTD